MRDLSSCKTLHVVAQSQGRLRCHLSLWLRALKGTSADKNLVANLSLKQAKIFVSGAKAPGWDINFHADIIGKKHCDFTGLSMCHSVLRSNDRLWAKCAECVNSYVRDKSF